jgi:hypothetical protein
MTKLNLPQKQPKVNTHNKKNIMACRGNPSGLGLPGREFAIWRKILYNEPLKYEQIEEIQWQKNC